nr:hypothetical protein [Clostridia bacterium]
MDKTGVHNCINYVRGYAPIVHTPVLVTKTKRMHVDIVSAITNKDRV